MFECFGDDPDFEGDGGDAEGAEKVVGGCSGEPCFITDKELLRHGETGEDEHEDGGRDDEPSRGFLLAEPEEDDEEGETAKELIGGAEERPEEEAAFAKVGEFP